VIITTSPVFQLSSQISSIEVQINRRLAVLRACPPKASPLKAVLRPSSEGRTVDRLAEYRKTQEMAQTAQGAAFI